MITRTCLYWDRLVFEVIISRQRRWNLVEVEVIYAKLWEYFAFLQ